MKTEQFDDEFRKKLLGLDPSDEEVDRIYNYVSSSGNITPHFSWTKILIYGLVASLLVGSITFNYVQNLTNKKLLSSLDSLKSRITSIELNSTQKTSLRVDTVYIDRYIEKTIAAQDRQELLYTRQSPHNEIQQPINNPITDKSVKNPNFRRADSPDIAPDQTAGTVAKSIAQNNASGAELNTGRSDNTVVKRGSSEITGNDNNPANKAAYTNKDDFPKAGKTIESYSSNTADNSNNAAQAKESKNWLLSELSRIGNIHLSFTRLKLPVLKTPEKLSSASKDKPKYYSESMKSVLKRMDYYVGGSLEAGNRQVAGSLLGELRITPKWSFQTGARWKEITGDSYDTAEQFGQNTGQDFRALYAPYVAQNVDLLNIEQNYQLVQIPLTIAYHYEIRPNWALRFGIGTDLTVYSLKDIHFNYKKDSQSFDKGEYNAKLSVNPFNDITINLGLERRSNKFLFRLSPYVSPQLRKTEFSNKDLLWGASVQVLYKFNR
ncbi:hypothetical protein LZD49_32570 [Dyadobacter sp. CY261]|uniref:hypothetical protein n=1 Tax=Dyadobacter sp. CY261 TaxID=2907203 RepID=UPI001F40D9ED|nr:hypothetical protein [Dyadobacter sp. CY261]MCF0075261.1 hypothetical protein [Dyadobacter sp. CY261]